MVEKLVLHQDDLDLGVVQDVGHLGRHQPPVDGHGDRVDLGRAEHEGEVLGDVLADEPDPALRADAGRDQRVGHLGGLGVEIPVGERAVVTDQRGLVRVLGGLVAGYVSNGSHCAASFWRPNGPDYARCTGSSPVPGLGLLAIEPATGHSDAMSGDRAPVDEIVPPVPDAGRMGSERLSRLCDQMRAQGVDGAVLMHGPHVTYATGHVPEAVDASHANHRRAVAIVSATDGTARLHAHDPVSDAVSACAEAGGPLWPELEDGAAAVGEAIAEVLGDVAGHKVAVDGVTGAMARTRVLDGAELVDASRVLGPARVVKTADELACIDQSQCHTERAMEAALAVCVPGATRAEVAGAFLAALHDVDTLGGDDGSDSAFRNVIDPIFQPMPTRRDGGPRTFTGHVAFPTGVDNPVFAEGDLVWVDAGVAWHGYMSDFGCTWVPGRAPTAAEQSLFDRWMAVLEASLTVVRPGATLGDVGRAARAVESEETPWLPQFYLAHGTGLESAEMPMIGTDLGQAFDDGYELAAGMVLVFEPVIWSDGVGGYRAEEIVAVTDDGWRRLGDGHHHEPFQT